ncbi:MAG: hypothetical protein RL199_357 [Pseudomonadota bacterium]|jgi:DNA invertase Pin-like site-specific DNA recombinase
MKPTANPPTPPVRRCAIYTRKSTTTGLEQAFNSLDAQREACEAFVARHPGWKVDETRYDDGGYTGANTDRPGFTSLMADAQAGKFDLVVVYKVDRFSRSMLDFVKAMERLTKAGVSFVSVTQNFSTADAMGRLTMNILLSFAEFEREMISERTRDKIAASRRRGQWTGGVVPLGYSSVDKKLVVHDLEANTVREAFRLYLQRGNLVSVGSELNKRGLVPRGTRNYPTKHPLGWDKTNLSRTLSNPIYAGLINAGDVRCTGEHEGLVTLDEFELVQDMLAGKRRPVRAKARNLDYLLRGLLTCKRCGKAMTTASTKRWRYYRCPTRDKRGREACPTTNVPAEAIEEFVIRHLLAEARKSTFLNDVASNLTERLAGERDALQKRRAELIAAIAEASTNAAQAGEKVFEFEGRARELLESRLRRESDRLAAAERQLAEVDQQLGGIELASREPDWRTAALRDLPAAWELMSSANRTHLLHALVLAVRVDEDGASAEIEFIDLDARDTRVAA